MLSIFSLGPLYVLLGEVSVQICCPFFNQIVCLPGLELCQFFFGDQTLVRGIICKNIFPYGWFPFHLADIFFSCGFLIIWQPSLSAWYVSPLSIFSGELTTPSFALIIYLYTTVFSSLSQYFVNTITPLSQKLSSYLCMALG